MGSRTGSGGVQIEVLVRGEVRVWAQGQEGYLGWIYADWQDGQGSGLIEDSSEVAMDSEPEDVC
jgi:hypothetical protein